MPSDPAPDARPARVLCVTQARMTSTRLPGKVLMEAAGRPLLDHHLGRLRKCRRIDELVVATSTLATDDAIEAFCRAGKTPVIRGSESDVLARFALAARKHPADIVVRATADCPLIDPGIVDALVETWIALDDPRAYVTADVTHLPRGVGAEVFAAAALMEAAADATDPHEREHVTSYFYRRPERFRVVVWTAEEGRDLAPSRWCVDEPADLEFVRRMLEALPPDAGWHEGLALLRRHPDWIRINADVRQRS